MENVSWLDPLKAQVFATTRWSVVRACGQASKLQTQEALAEICQSYWRTVHACIRHHGYPPSDAEDLTQDFFAQLLRGRYFRHLDQRKGRFRAYLSTALQNFLRDRQRRRWTWRHGRGITFVPLAGQAVESRDALDPHTHITPESLYERQWAGQVIAHALEQLKIELSADQRGILFEHFEAIAAGQTLNFPYADVAKSLNLSVESLHVALHRWRRRFQLLMREEIARTVLSKSEIDDELQHLHRVFAQTA